MSAFADTKDAKEYAREWLEEQAINDMYADEVETSVSGWHEQMHDSMKEVFRGGVENLTADDVMDLHAQILWRDVLRLVPRLEVQAIINECLPPTRPVQPAPEPEPVYEKYPDGSTEQHVIMEEVEEYIMRYDLHPVEVFLEVLSWHKAAQAVFARQLTAAGYSD